MDNIIDQLSDEEDNRRIALIEKIYDEICSDLRIGWGDTPEDVTSKARKHIYKTVETIVYGSMVLSDEDTILNTATKQVTEYFYE